MRIIEIKKGELQISRNELLVREALLKGSEYIDNLDYNKALKCYDNALEIDPNNANVWNNKGYVLGLSGRYKEAIDCYDKSLEIDPNNANVLNNKGNALYNLGKYVEAIDCYDKVLEIDPNSVYAWNNKGFSLDKLGRHNEAKRWKAMKQQSNNIDNDKRRVKCYTSEGKPVYETYIQ